MFSIRIVNFDRLKNSINRLDHMEGNVIQPGTREWMERLRFRLKGRPYPAKTPTQTYVRTGNLANSWGVDGSNGNWYVRNSADYSEWVVGDDQAKVHKGRWWNARQVAEEHAEDLADILVEKIEEQWR